jgi:hypothetical protein
MLAGLAEKAIAVVRSVHVFDLDHVFVRIAGRSSKRYGPLVLAHAGGKA